MPKDKIGITIHIPLELHKKVTDLAKDRKISLRQLTYELLKWAGENDVSKIVRSGVCVPIWHTDTFVDFRDGMGEQICRDKTPRG